MLLAEWAHGHARDVGISVEEVLQTVFFATITLLDVASYHHLAAFPNAGQGTEHAVGSGILCSYHK